LDSEDNPKSKGDGIWCFGPEPDGSYRVFRATAAMKRGKDMQESISLKTQD
jgi:hypothetical protein